MVTGDKVAALAKRADVIWVVQKKQTKNYCINIPTLLQYKKQIKLKEDKQTFFCCSFSQKTL